MGDLTEVTSSKRPAGPAFEAFRFYPPQVHGTSASDWASRWIGTIWGWAPWIPTSARMGTSTSSNLRYASSDSQISKPASRPSSPKSREMERSLRRVETRFLKIVVQALVEPGVLLKRQPLRLVIHADRRTSPLVGPGSSACHVSRRVAQAPKRGSAVEHGLHQPVRERPPISPAAGGAPRCRSRDHRERWSRPAPLPQCPRRPPPGWLSPSPGR
jgi:hypothetical protein